MQGNFIMLQKDDLKQVVSESTILFPGQIYAFVLHNLDNILVPLFQ